MPGGDRTGPNGMGPMTGRGAGFCGGWNRPGWSNRFGGWGGGFFGGRRGGGFGFRNRGWGYGYGPAFMPQDVAPAPSTANEKQWLQERTRQLESELEALRRRMDAMDTDQKEAE
ncbi:MAG: DUF5320 domain-containing protein [Candidatus Aminicenantes bacterium]|nr:DUF5320 domain-containing protein [Candidatus Aminicenantes bacterium]